MAATWITKPGTKFGPCKSSRCGHVDCTALRQTAKCVCKFCETEIGFDRRFYKDDVHGVCHASCLEDHYERKKS
jgi:hypothetical protein